MKKIMSVILMALILVVAAGCEQKTILTASDELVMYDWVYEDDNSVSARLSVFDDDTAKLTMFENGEQTLAISGMCIVNDNTITITDDKVYFDLRFEYKLYDDECVISYEGNKLRLKKQIKLNK